MLRVETEILVRIRHIIRKARIFSRKVGSILRGRCINVVRPDTTKFYTDIHTCENVTFSN